MRPRPPEQRENHTQFRICEYFLNDRRERGQVLATEIIYKFIDQNRILSKDGAYCRRGNTQDEAKGKHRVRDGGAVVHLQNIYLNIMMAIAIKQLQVALTIVVKSLHQTMTFHPLTASLHTQKEILDFRTSEITEIYDFLELQDSNAVERITELWAKTKGISGLEVRSI
jgi:hypothetical protein